MHVNLNVVRWLVIKLANNIFLVMVLYAVSLVVGSLMMMIVEGRSFNDGLWWSNVASLTIGYGDISPTTLVGRWLAMGLQFFWVFVIAPLIVANIILKVLFDRNQFSHAEQEWIMSAIEKLAVKQGVELPPQPGDTENGEVMEKRRKAHR
jgi:voltage-gated potassium channel